MNDRIGTRWQRSRTCKYNLRATKDADEATNNHPGSFDLSSFIAPAIVQFLGVRSLVRFGATSKFHMAVMLEEVERRRKQIVAVEVEVAKLIAPRPDNAVPTRMDIIAATNLVECTRRLIDDELEFHHKIGSGEIVIDNYMYDDDEYDWKEFDPFLQERMKFLPGWLAGEQQVGVGTLYVLPMCFYCPPEGESSNPSWEEVAEATEYAHEIWGAEEDLMQVQDYPWDWDRLKYEQPLIKFKIIGSQRFVEFMKEKAGELVWGMADAFRIAAREVFFENPDARDCLWYTIEQVDSMSKFTKYIKSAEIQLKSLKESTLVTPFLLKQWQDINSTVWVDTSLSRDAKISKIATQMNKVLKSNSGGSTPAKRKSPVELDKRIM